MEIISIQGLEICAYQKLGGFRILTLLYVTRSSIISQDFSKNYENNQH
jgi:hypothetical protein